MRRSLKSGSIALLLVALSRCATSGTSAGIDTAQLYAIRPELSLGRQQIDTALGQMGLGVQWLPPKLKNGDATLLRVGRIAGSPLSHVIVAQTGTAIEGTVSGGECAEACLRFERDQQGALRLVRPAPMVPPRRDRAPRLPSDSLFDTLGLGSAVGEASVPRAQLCRSENGRVITALIYFTPAAAVAAGGEDAMQSLVYANEEATNRAFANSGLPTRFQVLSARRLPYVESLNLDTDLEAFTMLAARERRAAGADVAFLIVTDTPDCGLSWLLRPDPTSWSDFAFGVLVLDCLRCNWTLQHELGHILGACHERVDVGVEDEDEECPYEGADCNYGYRNPDGTWGTLMAMTQEGSARLLRFSTPDHQCDGKRLGTPKDDNVSWLRKSAPIVAKFRCTQTTTN